MKVSALRQYLRSLAEPLAASAAPEQSVADLGRVCDALAHFDQRRLAEFAEFLERSQGYERDGHWPRPNPALAGMVVDEPTLEVYAARLRDYLSRAVPADGPVDPAVLAELDRLGVRLKKDLKKLAELCGVTEPLKRTQNPLDVLFLKLTGRSRTEAAAAATAGELSRLARDDSAGLEDHLKQLGKGTKEQVQAVARALGVALAGKDSKPALVQKLHERLAGGAADAVPPQGDTPAEADGRQPDGEKLARVVETLQELRAKADPAGAPYDEIEAELTRLEGQLDRAEAIAAARALGVAKVLDTRTAALEAIRRKVFESKLARESIAY